MDIHNHILPGIDDGAKDTEESIALIRGFAEFGVSNFISTPHIMHNFYDNTSKTIFKSLEELKAALLAEKIKNVSIEAAAEHMIDDNFEHLLESDAIMRIRKEYLLIEMSFLQPPIHFDEAIDGIFNKGLFPILAHPERYNFIRSQSNKYSQFKKRGILFQLNLLSLGDYYDPETRKKAIKLIEEGFIDFIASDAHSIKHLEALKNISLSKKRINQVIPLINNTIEEFY